jgi:hypothetical protein
LSAERTRESGYQLTSQHIRRSRRGPQTRSRRSHTFRHRRTLPWPGGQPHQSSPEQVS